MLVDDLKVSVTEKAIKQIRLLMEADNKQGHGLRVGVKSGGCSGLSYFMEF